LISFSEASIKGKGSQNLSSGKASEKAAKRPGGGNCVLIFPLAILREIAKGFSLPRWPV
jgi:hypothetical protein